MIPDPNVSFPAEVCEHPVRLTKRQRNYLPLKRGMDIILSAAALVLLFVPFVILAVLQKIDSPKEPVFFSQTRVGQNGKLFSIIKFRTMPSDAPRYRPSAQTEAAEQHASRLGAFLRQTSIDELPQLWNVLRGEMSIVGPRPLIPQEDDIHYLRAYYGISALRPGLTGWAQINGRDCLGVCEKVRFDREYLQKLSFGFDLKIFICSCTAAVWYTGK